MAFFNDLVRVIAELQGLDEMTVRGIGLNVRDAGHIRKGGRGLSAANMTSRDAASFLIGACATNTSKNAGTAVSSFYNISFANARGLSTHGRALLERIMLDDVSAGDFIAEIIELCASECALEFGEFLANNFDFPQGGIDKGEIAMEIERYVMLEVQFSRPTPRIDFIVRSTKDGQIWSRMYFKSGESRDGHDRREIVVLTQKTLKALGALIK